MVEVKGSGFSLELQLAAIFDSNRAGELHEKAVANCYLAGN